MKIFSNIRKVAVTLTIFAGIDKEFLCERLSHYTDNFWHVFRRQTNLRFGLIRTVDARKYVVFRFMTL